MSRDPLQHRYRWLVISALIGVVFCGASAFAEIKKESQPPTEENLGFITINGESYSRYRDIVPAELSESIKRGKVGLFISSGHEIPFPAVSQQALDGLVTKKSLLPLAGLIQDSNYTFLLNSDGEGKKEFSFELLLEKLTTKYNVRELLSVEKPQSIAGYRLLTFRAQDSSRDRLWIYSPAINKLRELTATNRSDALLSTVFAQDDFFTWSGAPQAVEVVKIEEKIVVAPQGRMYEQQSEVDICDVGVALPQRSEEVERQALFPSSRPFVAQKTLRIEIENNDPFSLYSRQVLYLSERSLLPLYKFVYDQRERLSKIVVSEWGMMPLESKRTVLFPWLTTLFQGEKRGSLELINLRSCVQPEEGAEQRFQPQALVPAPGVKGPVEKLTFFNQALPCLVFCLEARQKTTL